MTQHIISPHSFHVDVTGGDATPAERTYLEVIFYLATRQEPVIAARLARWLHVRPPTVTTILQRLLAKGYILRASNSTIALTPFGAQLAETIVRRHRLIERFLYDVLGIPWHQVHQEAVRLEPAVSPRILDRIEALISTATTCPHGNPIPGQIGAPVLDDVRLDATHMSTHLVITRIDEEAGEDACMLQRFWIRGLLPGTTLLRLSDTRDGVAVRLNDKRVVLSRRAASLIWVADSTARF